jgi:hypothetical protein
MQRRNVLLAAIATGAVGVAAGGVSLPSDSAVRRGETKICPRAFLMLIRLTSHSHHMILLADGIENRSLHSAD